MQEMNIAFCSDDGFVEPTLTAIESILQNNRNRQINFFIATTGLNEKSRKKIISYSMKNKNAKIEIVSADKKILDSCPTKKGDHVSALTYLRIFFPSLFPSLSKILYADGDVICVSNLENFYDTGISEKSCAAVRDERNDDSEVFSRLCYSEKSGYFNAGVILINLDWWRENSVQEKAVDYIKRNKEKCVWHDQDALNKILNGTVEFADFRYNVLQGFLFDRAQTKISSAYHEKIGDAVKNPCMIHYCSQYKPWHVECNHPWKNLWRNFYRDAFAKKIRLKFKNKGADRLKWIIKFVLNKSGIKKYADFRKPSFSGK
jgi:lipopolysaccharide biosynthesis glycosyltransferase